MMALLLRTLLTSALLGGAASVQLHQQPLQEHGHSMRPAEDLRHAIENQRLRDENFVLQEHAGAHKMWPFNRGKGSKGSAKEPAVSNEELSEKVEINIYYEALCPYCRNLINTSVAALWNDDEFRKRISLNFFPYGNAQSIDKDSVSDGYRFWHEELNTDGFDYVFACQHGAEECFGNTIQTCAIQNLKHPSAYVPFILCMESYNEQASLEMASFDCATEQKIDMEPIQECVTSKKGNKMMFQTGEATQALKPPHEYVPWVTLNGEHSEASEQDGEKDEGNLLREVCALLAEPKPKKC